MKNKTKKLSKKTEKRICKYTDNISVLSKFYNYEKPVNTYLSIMKTVNEKCLNGEFKDEVLEESVLLFNKKYNEL